MNNYEWLQSLNKEQLASWLAQQECAYTCSYGPRGDDCVEEDYPCEKGILEWLNQEHGYVTKENLCAYFTSSIRLYIDKNYVLYEDELNDGYKRFIVWKITKEDYENLKTYEADAYLINVNKKVKEFLDGKRQCKSVYVNPVECMEDNVTGEIFFKTYLIVK